MWAAARYRAGDPSGLPFSTICTVRTLTGLLAVAHASCTTPGGIWNPSPAFVEMVRLAVDLDEVLFENEGGLESGMSVAAATGALGDIGVSLHGLVAGRKIH